MGGYDLKTGKKLPYKRRKYQKKAGPAVKAEIKRYVSANTEAKRYRFSGGTYIFNANTLVTSVYALGGGLFPLSPYPSYIDISQGNTDSTRIGNSVKTKKCMVRMILAPNVYDGTYNPTPMPFIVKAWIFRVKQENNIGNIQTIINSYFKESNASSTGLAGTLYDIIGRDNTNVMQVLATRQWKVGYAVAGGTGVQAGSQSFANNEFKLQHQVNWDVTKHVYKKYMFNDNTSNEPTKQSATFMVMEAIAYNGDATNIGIRPGVLRIVIDYDYTDA